MKETNEKTEIVSKKIEQSDKIVNTRVIDPVRMAEKLSQIINVKIDLSSINDPEAQRLFSDLDKAFKLANWHIIGYSPNTSRTIATDQGVTIPQGIIIGASNIELANLLKSAFEIFKISCSIQIQNGLPANQLDVFIGMR
jgi:hypothetical protein